ncbi:MAG: hypothetical protein KGI66_04595 [Patescibacteria group bacterium]|nr:hypothetical protein [Patescibacteria group bacterium]
MSLTAMEIESHMPHLAAARGHTVVAGLGMGFALFNVLQNPKVTKVTLIEKDPDIISLMNVASDWQEWPNLDKLSIVGGDALEWRAEEHVDFLYADIWPLLGQANALSDTQRMQANIQADLIGYWGQELDFVEFDRARCFANLPTYRLFARKSGLPLIEQDSPRYPKLCWAAASLQVAAAQQKNSEVRRQLFLRYRDFLIGSLVDDQSVDPAYILEACREVA